MSVVSRQSEAASVQLKLWFERCLSIECTIIFVHIVCAAARLGWLSETVKGLFPVIPPSALMFFAFGSLWTVLGTSWAYFRWDRFWQDGLISSEKNGYTLHSFCNLVRIVSAGFVSFSLMLLILSITPLGVPTGVHHRTGDVACPADTSLG